MISPALLVCVSVFLLILGVCFVRIPIAMLLLMLGFSGYALLDTPQNAVQMLGNEFWSLFSSYSLTVIPLFILMGQLCFHSGLSRRLYEAVAAWFGHRQGGIAAATVLACGGFSAICGSNTATAAAMTVIALPEMGKYNYHKGFSAGVIAAGTTLGAVIPPSVVAIVLGVQTRLSIRDLFTGGLAPGTLLILLFLLTLTIAVKLKPSLAPAGERVPLNTRLQKLPGFLEAALLFALVIGGLGFAVFTPTEAGAAGSLLALLCGLLRCKLSLRQIGTALMETMQISAMIFLLLTGAGCFGKFLVLSRVPFELAGHVTNLGLGPLPVLLLIFSVFFIGGMIMDALALLLIAVPVFYPMLGELDVNQLWFCLMLLVITTAGAITPPIGASSYVVAGMGRIELGAVFKGSMLFIPAFIVCLVLMALFPEAVVWLPEAMR